MSIKRMTEKELLAGLNADKAHADELAEPLPHELSPWNALRTQSNAMIVLLTRFGMSLLILLNMLALTL